MNIFQYLQSDWRNILDLTLQHLELVGIAVSLAIAIGVPRPRIAPDTTTTPMTIMRAYN